MESALGWVQIARSDVAKATELLRGGVQGVRDEIGFLALHQGFANRFFPGTSVLQTRLRYALFVPWIFQDLMEQASRGTTASNSLEHRERELVIRLKAGAAAAADADGIIGIRSRDLRPAQPPSFIYWSALRTWGILQPTAPKRWPSRAELLAKVDSVDAFHRDHYDEGVSTEAGVFFALPDPPPEWKRSKGKSAPLNFWLRQDEKTYLRQRLSDVQRNGDESQGKQVVSLLTRLACSRRPAISWRKVEFDSPQVRSLADEEDREALRIARRASSSARVGRAVYAGLVEHAAEKFDGRSAGTRWRDELARVVAEERDHATNLSLDEVEGFIGPLEPKFRAALAATVVWLKQGAKRVDELWEPYRESEYDRKVERARLPRTTAGAKLRRAWLREPSPPADALNYRWHRISQMLDDLHGIHD